MSQHEDRQQLQPGLFASSSKNKTASAVRNKKHKDRSYRDVSSVIGRGAQSVGVGLLTTGLQILLSGLCGGIAGKEGDCHRKTG